MNHSRPRYLFDCLDDVRQQLAQREKLAIFLDLDGTLASITRTPKATKLKPQVREALELLAGDERFRLSIVSGRTMDDLKQIVKLTNVVYMGNHGLEIEGAGLDFIHSEARNRSVLVKDVCADVSLRLRSIKGLLVEFKTLTASVHYRLVASKQIHRIRAAVQDAVMPFRDQLYLTEGKCVFEVRPDVSWDKGSAVNWLLNHTAHDQAASIYVGDDKTDEDAFRNLPGSITINVGTKFADTAARYFVRSPAGVLAFLQCLPFMDKSLQIASSTLPLSRYASNGE